MNKIGLGTAQFGSNYGINNKKGKVSEEEAFEVFDFASANGVDLLDTALAYGESEITIGNYIRKRGRKFKIVSKLPSCSASEISRLFNSSLNNLAVDDLYGYLVHDFEQLEKYPGTWKILESLKADGKIKKIGFSLYYPKQLVSILSRNIKFDIIQLPYNIFDRRFGPYFPELADKGVEIHTRSVFLQGLVFKKPDALGGYFEKIKNKVSSLHSICRQRGIPLEALCINFAVLNGYIKKVIIGVDCLNNLRDAVLSSRYIENVQEIADRLDIFTEDDEKIILPLNWISR